MGIVMNLDPMRTCPSLNRLLLGFFVVLLVPPLAIAEENQPGDAAPTAEVVTAESAVESAAAQEPETADEQATDEPQLSPEEVAERQRQARAALALQARLNELSENSGPYDPRLIEVQQDLGQTYLQLDEFEQAAELLGQALQTTRVNDGLYSERQVSILHGLIHAYEGLEDWEHVDDYHHLLFDLNTRIHDVGSPGYAQALIDLSHWQVIAARHSLFNRPGRQQNLDILHTLQERHDKALEAAREQGDVNQQWELLYTRALTEVELARQYNYVDLDSLAGAAQRYTTQTVCRLVRDTAGNVRQVCTRQTVSNPDYYRTIANQQSMMRARARARMQATVRELETLLAENPEFEARQGAEAGKRLEIIQQAASDLQRTTRRSRLGERSPWLW